MQSGNPKHSTNNQMSVARTSLAPAALAPLPATPTLLHCYHAAAPASPFHQRCWTPGRSKGEQTLFWLHCAKQALVQSSQLQVAVLVAPGSRAGAQLHECAAPQRLLILLVAMCPWQLRALHRCAAPSLSPMRSSQTCVRACVYAQAGSWPLALLTQLSFRKRSP